MINTYCQNLIPKLDEIELQIKNFGVQLKPILILEGKTDFCIYDKMLTHSKVNRSKYDIAVAGGKKNINNFFKSKIIENVDYVALLDSDHDFYYGKQIQDDYVIYTHFYDMENYLTIIEVIESTYDDFKGITSKSMDSKKFITALTDLAYPSLIASEYKKRYLKKYGFDSNIFSMDIIKVKDTRLNCEKKLDERIYSVKEIIINESKKGNFKFDSELWDKTLYYLSEKLDKLEDIKLDEYIQMQLKGRRIIDIYREIFNAIFPQLMKDRTKVVFTNDLRKNFMASKQAKDLLQKIDVKLEKLLA